MLQPSAAKRRRVANNRGRPLDHSVRRRTRYSQLSKIQSVVLFQPMAKLGKGIKTFVPAARPRVPEKDDANGWAGLKLVHQL